jgi:hypothetical protein
MERIKGLFKRKKKQEDPLDVLREAYAGEDFKVPSQHREDVFPMEAEKKQDQHGNPGNPQLTIEKHEAITITETREPQPQLRGGVSAVTPSETFEDKMQRFRAFLDIVKGKVEIGSRLKPLLNPENLQTTTRLDSGEVDFVSDAHWLANQWKVFEPLRDLAHEISETKISEGGKGREEAISFMGALTEGKLLKGLMLGAEVPPKKGRFSFRNKGERKEEGEQ